MICGNNNNMYRTVINDTIIIVDNYSNSGYINKDKVKTTLLDY